MKVTWEPTSAYVIWDYGGMHTKATSCHLQDDRDFQNSKYSIFYNYLYFI
jgi:hypothetical protein